MKLLPNAGTIARRSHSMWAFYLGALCLNAPDLIYLTAQMDTNPATWSIIGNVLFAHGIVGRIIDQGISQ